MELLRDEGADLTVTEAGIPIGVIRASDVIARLIDARVLVAHISP